MTVTVLAAVESSKFWRTREPDLEQEPGGKAPTQQLKTLQFGSWAASPPTHVQGGFTSRKGHVPFGYTDLGAFSTRAAQDATGEAEERPQR